MIIGVHALHSVGPNAFNRDENGFPKMMTMGNIQRGRISSQAQKRAIRAQMESQSTDYIGWRTTHLRDKLLMPRLTERLVDISSEQLTAVADLIITAFAGTQNKDGTLAVPIFTWAVELDLLTDLIAKHITELLSEESAMKRVRKIAKTVANANAPKSLSLAMFGRMITALPEGDIDGAIAFSHAYTTHPAFLNVDNFTSVDDLSGTDTVGANFLGDQPFLAPSVFYRHFSINVTSLTKYLQHSISVSTAVRAVMDAFWYAVPSGGKQRSFKADEPPQFVAVSVGATGQSHGDAFINPVTGTTDLLTASIRRFDDNWQRRASMRRDPHEQVFVATGYPESLSYLRDYHLTGGYDELLDRLDSTLKSKV